jgi:DNA mismatch repair protein MutS
MLAAEKNNFLAAIYHTGHLFGLALADLTTGDFLATELDSEAALLSELDRLRPVEVIVPSEARALRELLGVPSGSPATANPSGQNSAFSPARAIGSSHGWIVNGYDDWVFAPETAVYTLREHFKVASLDGFGLKERLAAIGAAAAVLHYLTQHLRRDASHLTRLSFFQRSDFLSLDATSLRHLEILEPLHHDSSRNSSLYAAMNRTVTPMGARRLRSWLTQPLAAAAPIQHRQHAVRALLDDPGALSRVRAQLEHVRDLERTIGRLGAGSGNARDLVSLRLGLEQLPELKQSLRGLCGSAKKPIDSLGEEIIGLKSGTNGATASLLCELDKQITELPDLIALIARAIVDEPPLALKEGGMIRDNFDAALDELRQATRGGKDWIAKLQLDEITRTGIQSLKVRFNSVFGYYIEITKSNLDKVPAQYVRKQTIANGERFITPE